MRKNVFLLMLVLVLSVCVGCGDIGKVKVYDDTEESVTVHEECSITAVVTGVDLDNNLISFMNCTDGSECELIYHGGVSVLNLYGDDIGIDSISCGMIVDASYYEDTRKLVSISINSSAVIIQGVSKLTFDLENQKAVYKGTSCTVSDYLMVYDEGMPIDPMEISTEDQVTLYMYGGKLMSVVVEIGHGYVRLINQNTYIGGMVEIGYDVIVPVTDDMLLAVREGNYTLRINKNGYSDTMNVSVIKGRETKVDLSSIAIPTGTATFNITPEDAEIYVNGEKLQGYAYSNIYGNYELKIKADGYNTFNGRFKISEAVKVFTIELSAIEDTEDTTSEETTSDSTTGTDETDSEGSTKQNSSETTSETSSETASDNGSTTEDTNNSSTETTATTEAEQTGNVIKVNSPVGVGVYVDGEYVGVAPVSFKKEAGTHIILLYQTGFLIKSYTITATDDGQDDEYSFAALTSLADLLE